MSFRSRQAGSSLWQNLLKVKNVEGVVRKDV